MAPPLGGEAMVSEWRCSRLQRLTEDDEDGCGESGGGGNGSGGGGLPPNR